MRLQIPTTGPSDNAVIGVLPLAIGVAALTAAGLIGVSWFLIETLQDNSNKMRMYQVKSVAKTKSVEMDVGAGYLNIIDGMKNDHPESERLNDQANYLLESGQTKAALPLFLKSTDQFVNDLNGAKPKFGEDRALAIRYRCIARCYCILKDYDSALLYLNKSIEVRPTRESYELRASVYMVKNRYDLADPDLQVVRKYNDGSIGPATVVEDIAKMEGKSQK